MASTGAGRFWLATKNSVAQANSMSFAFLFPGQGSQFPGMLAEAAAAHPSVRERFREAGDAIGRDLWRLVRHGPEAELANTEVTQPALLTASVALWDVWRKLGGPQPLAMAGHSLGEYSALVCGGALSFVDGLRLVHLRGRLMQDAVPRGQGGMAAILGLDAEAVEACCAQVKGVASAANYNAPGQTVIAGAAEAVRRAAQLCLQAGARRAVPLDVSGPFHCALMAPVRERFAPALDGAALRMPNIPVVHNVDAQVADSAAAIRSKLLRQLAEPVRWVQCVERLVGLGATRLIECGPGKVLSGLARRIRGSLQAAGIGEPEALARELEAVLG